MILAHWNRARRTLTYASAGHEPVYLVRCDGRTEILASTGPMLGVEERAQWEEASLSVEPGDRLIMVTDGVTEAGQIAGNAFGKERLLALLHESRSRPLDDLPGILRDRVQAHRGADPQTDDITMLAVEL